MTHLNSKTQSSIARQNISGLAVSKTPVRAGKQIYLRSFDITNKPNIRETSCSYSFNIISLTILIFMSAQEILSVLKRPATQKNVSEMDRKSVDVSHVFQSSQRKQQSLQDVCPEGRNVVELSEESKKIHEPRRQDFQNWNYQRKFILSDYKIKQYFKLHMASLLQAQDKCLKVDFYDIRYISILV